MGEDTKTVLRDNVRRLLGLQAGESGVQRLIDKGFANGTAQRVLGGQTSVGVDVVEKLAAAFDVAPVRLRRILQRGRVEVAEVACDESGDRTRAHRTR